MNKVLMVSLVLFSANVVGALFGKERHWSFIQSVGGIAIENPIYQGDNWLLPVRCNVAGLKAITLEPTSLNSGLVWADTEVKKVENGVIYITVETALVGMGGNSSDCGPAYLKDLEPGKYKVVYVSPNRKFNEIADIEVSHLINSTEQVLK